MSLEQENFRLKMIIVHERLVALKKFLTKSRVLRSSYRECAQLNELIGFVAQQCETKPGGKSE